MHDRTKSIPATYRGHRLCKAFCIVCLTGVYGVLYDLDHVLVLWARGLPITLDNLAHKAGRPLHIPGLLVWGALSLIGCALLFGRAARAVEGD